jgi:hypothetical protein
VATKDDAAGFAWLLGCLVEGNQVWASRAPVLMVSFVVDRNLKQARTRGGVRDDEY